MTALKILFICALSLAPCAALYARFRWGAEKTLPLSLCAQGLFLYSFGLFLPFSCCVAALCVICLICIAYFFIHTGEIQAMLRFISVPVVLFVLGAPLLYYACCDRLYLSYDEYSHWGLIIKLISAFDALPRQDAGAPLLLFNYPPAGAMLPALCCQVFGYREGVAYFGYALFLWGLLLGLLPQRGGSIAKVLAALILLLCMMVIFPFTILRLFSEPLIALLFALLVIYAIEGEKTRIQWVRTGGLVAFLALTKNSAPLFVALYLLVRVCLRPQKREGRYSVILAFIAAAAFFSYLAYCRLQGISPAFETYFTQNIKALISGTLDERYASVPGRFISYFFAHPFSQSGVYSTYGVGTSAAVLYAALAALCAIQTVLSPRRCAAVRLWSGIWLGSLGYVVFILLSYVFFFNPSEAQRLNELDRYLSLPALWTGLIVCALIMRDACQASARKRWMLVGALLAVELPLCHPALMIDTLFTRQSVKNTLWAREETANTAQFLRGQIDFTQRCKIRLLGACDHMALRYEMILEADFGHPYSNWGEAAFVGTLEGVQEEIDQGGYEYVFVAQVENDDPMRAVDARYAPLFEGGEEAIRPFSLYRVKKESDANIRLVYIASRE